MTIFCREGLWDTPTCPACTIFCREAGSVGHTHLPCMHAHVCIVCMTRACIEH